MTDSDIESVYKSSVAESHYAGLRAVFDAGYNEALGITPVSSTPDVSLTQSLPSSDVTVSTP